MEAAGRNLGEREREASRRALRRRARRGAEHTGSGKRRPPAELKQTPMRAPLKSRRGASCAAQRVGELLVDRALEFYKQRLLRDDRGGVQHVNLFWKVP
jgi:hypothetical protein